MKDGCIVISPPKKLYKYCAFSVYALRALSRAEVFYANPRSFNDPLDCSPVIERDADRQSIERLCFHMLTACQGSDAANKRLAEFRYMSTEVGDYKLNQNAERRYLWLINSEVKRLLDADMASYGVLSLAANWDCPLMWSHYADQHRGICIEYDMTTHACPNMRPVDYERPTSIAISDLVKWRLEQSNEAEAEVRNTYFFAKSPEWKYEAEWRDVHRKNGVQSAPFKISAVHFGLRCDDAVKTSIVTLLAETDFSPLEFFDMFRIERTSRLDRRKLDSDEIIACAVSSSPELDFLQPPAASELRVRHST